MSDALYNALGTNDATQVAAVLSSMEDDVNSTENARLSPLGFYLQHGDDPRRMFAAKPVFVQALLSHGADKALVDADGLSLQDMGCTSARPGISELF
eukprot:gene2621-24252_t